MADISQWRALVDKELAGASFDKLVQKTAEGLAIEPLYVERPAGAARPATRGGGFRVCVRARKGDAAAELDGGADALWLDVDDYEGARIAAKRDALIVSSDAENPDIERPPERDDDEDNAVGPSWLSFDPVSMALRLAPHILHDRFLRTLVEPTAQLADDVTRCVRISSLEVHAAGADAADELAYSLATAAAYLRVLTDSGMARERVASQLWFQIAIGRDTFGELCKLRALRVVAAKLFAAAQIAATLPPIHAVSSSRTQTARDPWVNLLRVTTEVFAAAIGGAELITPLAFDSELAEPSALGRRVARNTALVLRDESFLGRVADAAGGSYYLDARTDALAREAWQRFRAIEQAGGIVKHVSSGALTARLASSWSARAASLAKRKEPVLGVSEFANLGERLPSAPRVAATATSGLPHHRDAEGFEALRARLEGAAPRTVALIALGPPSEHRARTGYAQSVFAIAGIRTTQISADALPAPSPPPDVACICGSDERYAAEAATVAAQLHAAGTRAVIVAGRPGELEAALREAGVTAFIYIGCDVLATLTELLP